MLAALADSGTICSMLADVRQWDLQQHNSILDTNDTLIELLEQEPELYRLLVEAVGPLKNAFGDGLIMQLRVQSSGDESLLKVAVQLPADFAGDPECALRSFDAEWWLDNCHRSGGALVFDYEVQDLLPAPHNPAVS
jgi:hypothetical protein